MVTGDYIILAFAACLGIYMAANIGANDLANAMGTSVGSGALTMRRAVLAAVIFDFAGAVLAGGHVTNTIRKGIIDPMLLVGSPEKLMVGMFAALLAAAIWVHIATVFALPVSTTHSIVGAVVGFGVVAVGVSAVSWGKVAAVAASWVVSPLAGAAIAALIYYLISRKILAAEDPYREAQHYTPLLMFLTFSVLILSIVFKGLKNLHLNLTFLQALLVAVPLSAALGFAGRLLITRLGHEGCRWIRGSSGHERAECYFGYLQIMTACYVAFAHGANDVANAVGPMAAIFSVARTHSVVMKVEVPLWMLAAGGLFVGAGIFAFGTKVMETIGKKITEITPVRGFSAEFGAATTILICSRMGLPVSTTHVLVGAVVGVGVMRGMGFIDLRVIKNILYSWFITVPFTTVLCMIFYTILIRLF